MNTDFYKGILKRWNDDRGFGFIESNNGKGDIFLHISALKQMSRRPVVGDIIHYQIHTDHDGKKRTVNAKIEGVSEIQPHKKVKNLNKNNSSGWLTKVITAVFLLLLVVMAGNKSIQKSSFVNSPVTTTSTPKEPVNYTCNGKKYCSEMTSCEEAKFYLNNCPGTEMDGDDDGIPCESQWCSW